MSEGNKKPNFELSADASLLVTYLRDKEPGSVTTYGELSTELGRTITGSDPALAGARRVLRRDHDLVFDCVRGEGVVLLTDDQVNETRRHRGRKRIHNTCRKTIKDLATVNIDTIEDKVGYHAGLSYYGTLAAVTKQKSFERIEARVNANRPDRLPIGISLEALKEQ